MGEDEDTVTQADDDLQALEEWWIDMSQDCYSSGVLNAAEADVRIIVTSYGASHSFCIRFSGTDKPSVVDSAGDVTIKYTLGEHFDIESAVQLKVEDLARLHNDGHLVVKGMVCVAKALFFHFFCI